MVAVIPRVANKGIAWIALFDRRRLVREMIGPDLL
jgi:hypothetical protein